VAHYGLMADLVADMEQKQRPAAPFAKFFPLGPRHT